jgi:hypothetical protein
MSLWGDKLNANRELCFVIPGRAFWREPESVIPTVVMDSGLAPE